jgi:hypothetical protein
MPCYSGPSPEDIKREQAIRDGKTKVMCRACAILDEKGLLPDYLRPWYDAHRAVDDNRNSYEAARRKCDNEEANAMRQGLQLGYNHPARKLSSEMNNKLRKSEEREQDELVKLADAR